MDGRVPTGLWRFTPLIETALALFPGKPWNRRGYATHKLGLRVGGKSSKAGCSRRVDHSHTPGWTDAQWAL